MQYQDIKTNEIVKITNDNSSFFTLSNGLQILKSIFNKKFVPVTTEMNKLKQEIVSNSASLNEQIKQNIPNMNNNVIDPSDFFSSPLSITPKEIQEKLSNVNTGAIADIPDSQRIKVNIPVD